LQGIHGKSYRLSAHVLPNNFGILIQYVGGDTKGEFASFERFSNPVKRGGVRNGNQEYIRVQYYFH
jgi:hypothetical protein